MKILLYTGARKLVEKSGVGKAISHQERALGLIGAEYTETAQGDYDVVHLNTIFPDSWLMARRPAERENGSFIMDTRPWRIFAIPLWAPI